MKYIIIYTYIHIYMCIYIYIYLSILCKKTVLEFAMQACKNMKSISKASKVIGNSSQAAVKGYGLLLLLLLFGLFL